MSVIWFDGLGSSESQHWVFNGAWQYCYSWIGINKNKKKTQINLNIFGPKLVSIIGRIMKRATCSELTIETSYKMMKAVRLTLICRSAGF